MIGIFLQTTPFLSGGIGDFLNNLASLGFFNYALPFLIIFALVFGILTKMNMFRDSTRAVSAIIALAVSLMALQFNIVPQFFSQIFPSLGIGLSIVLIILIIIGFFSDPDKPWIKATFFIIAIIIALVVIVSSSGIDVWGWLHDNLGDSTAVILIIAVMVIGVGAVVFKKNPNAKPFDNYNPHAFKQ